jgi:hypothetical protein
MRTSAEGTPLASASRLVGVLGRAIDERGVQDFDPLPVATVESGEFA